MQHMPRRPRLKRLQHLPGPCRPTMAMCPLRRRTLIRRKQVAQRRRCRAWERGCRAWGRRCRAWWGPIYWPRAWPQPRRLPQSRALAILCAP